MARDNVIDITERMTENEMSAQASRLKGLKVRLDLEQAKIAISTSLLSVVVLVTLANNNLLVSAVTPRPQDQLATRGIASVNSDFGSPASEDNKRLVQELSSHSLASSGSVGHLPSPVEKLAFGYLEGKYSVRMLDGKLEGVEFNPDLVAGASPKRIDDYNAFIESHRDLMPVAFDKSLKIHSMTRGEDRLEVYQLMDRFSMPLAKVQFKLDNDGRMLAMLVQPSQVATR